MVAYIVRTAEKEREPRLIAEALESELKGSGLSPRDLALTFSTLETALSHYLGSYERAPGLVACSFCHKTQGAVALIIQGPTAAICDECVTIAVDMVKEKQAEPKQGALGRLTEWFRGRT
jgi:hypothetical protein